MKIACQVSISSVYLLQSCMLYLFQQYPQTSRSFSSFKNCVCCICFSNTLKQSRYISFENKVCVVFVLAIPSNMTTIGVILMIVCVVFVLAIPSNPPLMLPSLVIVCVVFVLAIPSNRLSSSFSLFKCVLYLFQQYPQTSSCMCIR